MFSYMKYSEKNRNLFDKFLSNSLNTVSMQEYGYPRFKNFNDLISEYSLYNVPYSDSTYVILYDNHPIGICGFLYEDNYAALWGPFTENIFYNGKTFDFCFSLLAEKLKNKIDYAYIYIAQSNILLTEYLETSRKLKKLSIQHVMKFTKWVGIKNYVWSNPDYEFKRYTYDDVKNNSTIKYKIQNLLTDAFQGKNFDQVDDLIEEKCYFDCVWKGTKLISFVIWNVLENSNEIRIEFIATHANYQKLGIAKKLFLQLMCHIRKTYSPQFNVNLVHSDDKDYLHRFYQNVGFEDEVIYNVYKINTSIYSL